jgi:hypothetical protein
MERSCLAMKDRRTSTRRILGIRNLTVVLAAMLCGCGGGGSASNGTGSNGSSGENGGSGTTPALSISILAPSFVNVGSELGTITIYGQGFTEQSQILLDGKTELLTSFMNSTTLQGEIDPSLSATVGTHEFSVQGPTVSNSLTYTVYAPQQGPLVMQAIPGFLVGEGEEDANCIVAADVNGDGLADVIMPGPPMNNVGSIAILDGQSNGLLGPAQYISVPVTPWALAVGDVDGNGTADIVSITSLNATSTTVSVLFGDGKGNFQPPVTQQTFNGIYPGPAQLADLDGDGKLDLVLEVESPDSIVWLKNTGSGFAAPVTLAAMNASLNFSIADFDGNGLPDILYTFPGSATEPEGSHILMNQGNGVFIDEAPTALSGIVGWFNAFDFNRDGIPDIVVQVEQSAGGLLYSFEGTGNGSFTQVATVATPFWPILLVSGDFDNDGFPDLAGPQGLEPSQIFYFFGDGQGNFTVQSVVGPEGEFAATADVNGDGIPDLVVPDRFNLVSLALGRTGRDFPSTLPLSPSSMTGISAGNITKGGLPEILVSGDPGTMFQNVAGSSFQFGSSINQAGSMLADLTGKGVVDLIGLSGTELEIWPNNGSLDFSSNMISLPVASSGPFTVADLDGDGCPDIIGPGQVFYGNCNYQFTPTDLAIPVSYGSPYVVGDFAGNGRLDIATPSAVLMNSGGRAFQQVPGTLPLINGVITAVADFNGDGKADVAISDDGVFIYYSNGDGTFYQGVEVDPGQAAGALVAGDFNGDGKPDLAVGLMYSQQVSILFNAGNGEFTRSFFASGAFAVAMLASDLSNNGKLDLVIANYELDFAPLNLDVMFHQ